METKTHRKASEYKSEIDRLSTAQRQLLALRLTENRHKQALADQLTIFITLKPNSVVSEQDIRTHLIKLLPSHMLPSQIERLKTLPRTPSGKIDRKALSAMKIESSNKQQKIEPENDLERVLKGIWESILNIRNIGTTDNFFNIGGHSLLVIRIISQVRDIFPLELSLNSLFEHPTILDLAKYILDDPEKRPEIERTAELYLQVAELSEDELDDMLERNE